MDQAATRRNSASMPQPGSAPDALGPLQRRLEQIRQQQWHKNRPSLRGLALEQQRQIELLTVAIVARILGEVENEWQVATTAGEEYRLCQVLSKLWGTA